jgi:hypothetical protein
MARVHGACRRHAGGAAWNTPAEVIARLRAEDFRDKVYAKANCDSSAKVALILSAAEKVLLEEESGGLHA